MTRKCSKCPDWTQTVCRHAWGVYWSVKSDDGRGCDLPMDDVAEAWRKAGWKPGAATVPIVLPMPRRQKPRQAVMDFTLPPLEDL